MYSLFLFERLAVDLLYFPTRFRCQWAVCKMFDFSSITFLAPVAFFGHFGGGRRLTANFAAAGRTCRLLSDVFALLRFWHLNWKLR